MFGSYVFEKSSAAYTDKVLLIDKDELQKSTNYCRYFSAQGFHVVHYTNDLDFRANHDDVIHGQGKYAVLASGDVYIPYDIRQQIRVYEVSIATLFPNLNAGVIKDTPRLNYDLLSRAYRDNFKDLTKTVLTEQFIKSKVYGISNVKAYLQAQLNDLRAAAKQAVNYRDWLDISELKSSMDILATEHDIEINTTDADEIFAKWILKYYGKLSAVIDRNTPVLVSKAMEFMHDQSEKFAIIVMDGMSQLDWKILESGFSRIKFEKSAAYAMIPTVTSVSRQCLLSNQFPLQLQEPWKQSKEKNEFIDCALRLGYTREQVDYQRGYDADFGAFVTCGAVIINEIDDTVHGQGQGRIGMFNDVSVMAKQNKLPTLVKRLLKKGFDVYISADHGNTPCVGDGRLMGTGVETETKSHRMLVLKDFADKEALISKYSMMEFPKYFLPKEFDYLICAVGHSFDAKNDEVMNHGGISVDEVIVPFITIKAGENNG